MTAAKILIVDDDADFRDVMHTILERAGYFVLEAGDGRQALTIIDRFAPDLVLVDVNMPVLSGPQFVQALRRRGDAHTFEVVTISGSIHAHSSPTEWFLPKPFEVGLLLTLVESFCGRRALSAFWTREQRPESAPLAAVAPMHGRGVAS